LILAFINYKFMTSSKTLVYNIFKEPIITVLQFWNPLCKWFNMYGLKYNILTKTLRLSAHAQWTSSDLSAYRKKTPPPHKNHIWNTIYASRCRRITVLCNLCAIFQLKNRWTRPGRFHLMRRNFSFIFFFFFD